jgi:hypothetical protein
MPISMILASAEIAVRIDKGEAISTLQVLERHRFDECRLASARLPNDVKV